MRILRPIIAIVITASLAVSAFADKTDKQKTESLPHMTSETRVLLIRLLQSEYVFVRRSFPQGRVGLFLKSSGEIANDPKTLSQLFAMNGIAAKPGDQVLITQVKISGKNIILEINGGPKKKSRWYQHISVGMGGNEAPISQQKPEEVNSKGSYLVLEFPEYIPEMDKEQLRRYLAPVLDFEVKSQTQAFIDTLPIPVRNAVVDHHVLVGMDREMVVAALGRPPRKIREREEKDAPETEEWVYGTPPDDVQFIRFTGEEVTQVKIMKVSGEKIVRTGNEMPSASDVAAAKNASAKAPAKTVDPNAPRPSLRRPGEMDPTIDKTTDVIVVKQKPGDVAKPKDPGDPPPLQWRYGSSGTDDPIKS